MVLSRLALPFRQWSALVLCSELTEVVVDVVLRQVFVLAHLLPKLIDMLFVLEACARTLIFEFVLPACLLGLKGHV